MRFLNCSILYYVYILDIKIFSFAASYSTNLDASSILAEPTLTAHTLQVCKSLVLASHNSLELNS